MDDLRDIVGRNLRRLRNEKGWSQEELAFRAKVDRSYISQLETATYSASVTMLGKLAKALGVDASDSSNAELLIRLAVTLADVTPGWNTTRL